MEARIDAQEKAPAEFLVRGEQGFGQAAPLLFVKGNPLIHDPAKVPVDLGFVLTMAARPDERRRPADIAPLFLIPFHEFPVGIAFLHDRLSVIRSSTSFSW